MTMAYSLCKSLPPLLLFADDATLSLDASALTCGRRLPGGDGESLDVLVFAAAATAAAAAAVAAASALP